MPKHEIYSPAGRKRIADRLLASFVDPKQLSSEVTAGLQIRWYNGERLGSGNPYGFLPFMLTATPTELQEAIAYCGKKKEQFAEFGDVYRSWLYGSRQSLLSGLLTHTVRMGIV